MEWNNVKMSRVEFERLLKEYTSAALRTAEKAKVIDENERIKAEITIASHESKPELPKTVYISEGNSTTDNTDKEEKFDTEDTESVVVINAEIKQEDAPVAEPVEEESEYEAEEYTEPEEENKETDEQQTEQSDNCNEQTCEEECAEEENSSDETEKCSESVDDILDSFKSMFISEEEAEKKAEEMSENKNIKQSAPNFNSAIHNHNKSVKSCGCARCRSNNSTTHMQEKGGNDPG